MRGETQRQHKVASLGKPLADMIVEACCLHRGVDTPGRRALRETGD